MTVEQSLLAFSLAAMVLAATPGIDTRYRPAPATA